MAEDVYFGPTVHALGTFPVTQQVEGSLFAVAGVALTILSIAKLIFDEIRKLAGSKDLGLNKAIRDGKDRIGIGILLTIFGVATFTPILGTIANGVFWYRETHQECVQIRSFPEPPRSYTFRTNRYNT